MRHGIGSGSWTVALLGLASVACGSTDGSEEATRTQSQQVATGGSSAGPSSVTGALLPIFGMCPIVTEIDDSLNKRCSFTDVQEFRAYVQKQPDPAVNTFVNRAVGLNAKIQCSQYTKPDGTLAHCVDVVQVVSGQSAGNFFALITDPADRLAWEAELTIPENINPPVSLRAAGDNIFVFDPNRCPGCGPYKGPAYTNWLTYPKLYAHPVGLANPVGLRQAETGGLWPSLYAPHSSSYPVSLETEYPTWAGRWIVHSSDVSYDQAYAEWIFYYNALVAAGY